jgi:TDG/mug DNA glycosylase family protein
MRGVEPNAIPALIEKCRRLRAIFLNGRKAEDLFRKLVLPDLGQRARSLVVRYLPSTSPANAGMKLEDKLRAWRVVKQYTGERDGG